jgi:hypothetical protein
VIGSTIGVQLNISTGIPIATKPIPSGRSELGDEKPIAMRIGTGCERLSILFRPVWDDPERHDVPWAMIAAAEVATSQGMPTVR